MNINAKKAQDKLSQELSAAKLGKYAQAVAKPTLEVLKLSVSRTRSSLRRSCRRTGLSLSVQKTLLRVQGEVSRISRSTAEL